MPHTVYLALMAPALGLALWWLARRRSVRALEVGTFAILAWGLLIAPPVARLGGRGIFGVLALVAWTVFGVLPAFLALGAQLLRAEHPRWSRASLAISTLLLIVSLDAFLIEPRRLEVSRVRIETGKLSRPLRVAVLADIQTDRVGDYERRAIARAVEERPDLILFAGDYVQTDAAAWDSERAALRRVFEEVGLAAPLGAFAVRGNCDLAGWEQVFEGLPVHVFEETGRVELEELAVTGLSFPDSFRRAPTIPESGRFEIVLGHAPDFALEPTGADLLVAGHCHGGQVCLPFIGPLMTLSRVPRAWASGTRELRPGTWLCVSRGIGMERRGAPPLRFLCRPEVVILDLVPRGPGPSPDAFPR